MKRLTSNKAYQGILLFILVLTAIWVRLPNFHKPLYDAYYFRQTQTATVARNFYEKGINLLRPELDIFGIGKEQYLIHESPLYQAVYAGLSNIFGFSDQLGRAISIASGMLAGLCLYALVIMISHKKPVAFLALTFFYFFPLSIFFERVVLIESFVLFLHLLSLVLWLWFLRRGKIALFLVTTLVTIMALIGKIIYAPFLLLFILVILIHEKGKKGLWLPEIIIFFSSVSLAAYFWQTLANRLNILSGNEFFTSENPEHWLWNVGYLHERWMLNIWRVRIMDILGAVTKIGAGLVGMGIIYLLWQKLKDKWVWLAWFLIMLAYYLIFFRINSHVYYFLQVLPSLAVLSAYGIWGLWQILKQRLSTINANLIVFLLLSAFVYKATRNVRGYFVIHEDIGRKIEILNREMKESGPMVMVFPKWDWNSVYTYYTRRKGVVLKITAMGDLSQYQAQGYRYTVFLDFAKDEIEPELLARYNLEEQYRDEGVLISFFKNPTQPGR